MPVVCIKSNVRVHENAGRAAVMRGPVLYCAEGIDNGKDLAAAILGTSAEFKTGDNVLYFRHCMLRHTVKNSPISFIPKQQMSMAAFK